MRGKVFSHSNPSCVPLWVSHILYRCILSFSWLQGLDMWKSLPVFGMHIPTSLVLELVLGKKMLHQLFTNF